MPDLGVLLSDDPVAVDKASVDLINYASYSPLWSTVDKFNDQDKFRAIYQDIDWNWQLDYGQQMGIGNKEYKIVKV